MNQASLVSTANLRKFKDIAIKHCPTLYDEINKYDYEELPERPKELDDFYKLNKETQAKERNSFFNQVFIQEYLDEKWKIEVGNITKFERLHELHEGVNKRHEIWDITESDKIAIKNKMDHLKHRIESNPNPYFALKINFSKFGFKKETQQEVIDEINDWEE